MKKNLLTTTIILLVAFCLNSQTLNDLLERKNKAVSVIKDLKSAKDQLSTSSLELSLNLDNKNIVVSASLTSKLCGENESTEDNFINLNVDGVYNESVFRYIDKKFNEGPCDLMSNDQYQSNKNLETDTSLTWEICFLPKPKENSIYVYNKFSKNFLNNYYKNENDKKNHFNIIAYQLIGDSVFIYKVGKIIELKNKKKEFFMVFKDGVVKDKNDNVLFNYKGSNKYSLMKMYFATLFYFKEFQFAKEQKEILVKRNNEIRRKNDEIELKRINENLKKSAAEWEVKKSQYLTKSKNCKYCNVKYSGVSFEFNKESKMWNSKTPCKARIDEVYFDAFCSRKCVLDHCNSTH
jgi:hypothetical protein